MKKVSILLSVFAAVFFLNSCGESEKSLKDQMIQLAKGQCECEKKSPEEMEGCMKELTKKGEELKAQIDKLEEKEKTPIIDAYKETLSGCGGS